MKTALHFFLAFSIATAVQATQLQDLRPRPKESWLKDSAFFGLRPNSPIVVTDLSEGLQRSHRYFNAELQRVMGAQLTVSNNIPTEGETYLLIGKIGNAAIDRELSEILPARTVMPGAEGYVIDISEKRILVAGADERGVFNAMTTLIQLIQPGNVGTFFPHVFIRDFPDYPIRWAFDYHNGLSQGPAIRKVMDSLSFYKFNGFQTADWNYSIIQVAQPRFVDSAKSLLRYADSLNLETIPTVMGQGWSSNILRQDPNLATGFPARQKYLMEADTARLIADPRVSLPNGGFEQLKSNGEFSGWGFYDGPGLSVFRDSIVKHSGKFSARCTDFEKGNSSGNCRFNRLIACEPNSYVTMSCFIKTENLKGGFVQILALGFDPATNTTRSLTFAQFDNTPTMDWRRGEVRFNSLNFSQVYVYVGVWGGVSGTIWFDDFEVKQAGLCNVLRREGTPLNIANAVTDIAYSEGADFFPIVDSIMEQRLGNYGQYHAPAQIRRTSSSRLSNGDTILVSFYHPITCVSDMNCNGSTMNTMSDDKVLGILRTQAEQINMLIKPQKFFLGHDEIRGMNWDAGDQKRNTSPRVILGQNINWCDSILMSLNPKAETFVWSDMIDSTHNATKDYYLINGDLRGIWNDVKKKITMVNWNGGEAQKSLGFFERHGFRQITSPYYDVGNSSSIRAWRLAEMGHPSVRGGMYTTWNHDYSQVKAFACYYWSAGPQIVHKPLTPKDLGQESFKAQIFPDPFDGSDAIVKTSVEFKRVGGDSVTSFGLFDQGVHQFTFLFSYPPPPFLYRVTATNSQGFSRVTPFYFVGESVGVSLNDHQVPAENLTAHIEGKTLILSWMGGEDRPNCDAEVTDIAGKLLARHAVQFSENGLAQLDVSNLPTGSYRVSVSNTDQIRSTTFTLLR